MGMKNMLRHTEAALGSGRMFVLALAVFVLETGWLAFTSRFPMAYDEAYHFGLIRLFAHRANPFITSQTPDTYRFGPLIHSPPFIYHYLLSFVYRLMDLFAFSTEAKVICLRLLNVALAMAGLIVIRKILRLLRMSDALANLLILVTALTPMMTVVSSQINYDNMLIPAVALCVYQTILFLRQLEKNIFDVRRLLILLALCLFSSLIKFAFLPIFAAVVALLAWNIARRWRADSKGFKASARKNFAAMSGRTRAALITLCILGALLFSWFYLINLVQYHNPVPRCTQVFSIDKCAHYPPWDYLYKIQTYYQAHPSPYHLNPARYTVWWLTANTVQLYGTQIPIEGSLHTSATYVLIVLLIGTTAFVCTVVNIRKIFREHPGLAVLMIVSLTYLVCLWARNYDDYLRIGLPSAIHGRYWLPVLPYLYALLALGLNQALKGRGRYVAGMKAGLALVVIGTFLYFGGFQQYIHAIDPVYGRLSPSDRFLPYDSVTGD